MTASTGVAFVSAEQALALLAMLFAKHFVVDFPLQGPYQYLNKGTYGHPGGLLHSGMHGLCTFLAFAVAAPGLGLAVTACAALGAVDAVVHYHVDWAKVKLNRHFGWGPSTHEQFWWLLGADQLLHAATYLGLVAWVVLT